MFSVGLLIGGKLAIVATLLPNFGLTGSFFLLVPFPDQMIRELI
jgi:hypothetical protein